MSVSVELSQTIINNQVTSMLILDESLMIRYAYPAAEQLFSQSAKRLMHQSLNHLVQHSSRFTTAHAATPERTKHY